MLGTIIGAGASLCVDVLMNNAVRMITPTAASKLTKWAAMAGAMAVSGVVGKYIGDSVDETVTEIKTKVKEQRQLDEAAEFATEGEA